MVGHLPDVHSGCKRSSHQLLITPMRTGALFTLWSNHATLWRSGQRALSLSLAAFAGFTALANRLHSYDRGDGFIYNFLFNSKQQNSHWRVFTLSRSSASRSTTLYPLRQGNRIWILIREYKLVLSNPSRHATVTNGLKYIYVVSFRMFACERERHLRVYFTTMWRLCTAYYLLLNTIRINVFIALSFSCGRRATFD